MEVTVFLLREVAVSRTKLKDYTNPNREITMSKASNRPVIVCDARAAYAYITEE
jgi:hypothetical protein